MCVVGLCICAATVESSMEVSQKIKNRTAISSSSSNSGYLSKEMKILTQKDVCMPMFVAALFVVAKIWKQPKCPSMDEWVKKLWYNYGMEYY